MTDIVRAIYGAQTRVKDVTVLARLSLTKNHYVAACNSNFGDVAPGMKKSLILTFKNNRRVIIPEDHVYHVGGNITPVTAITSSIANSKTIAAVISPNIFGNITAHSQPIAACELTVASDIDYIIYYHIFANEGNSVLRIFEEQVETILASPFFPRIKQVRCCLTGDNTNNFNMLLKRIQQLAKHKFVIRRAEFGNRTYEKFTLYCIKDDVMVLDQQRLPHTYICYIHTKGITHDSPQVTDWRRCMEYFLITRANKTLRMMCEQDAESAGISFCASNSQPISNHYSGNFWIARATLLHRTFTANPSLGNDGTNLPVIYNRYNPASDYYTGEMFIFRDGIHKFINLFPIPQNFVIYESYLPRERYVGI